MCFNRSNGSILVLICLEGFICILCVLMILSYHSETIWQVLPVSEPLGANYQNRAEWFNEQFRIANGSNSRTIQNREWSRITNDLNREWSRITNSSKLRTVRSRELFRIPNRSKSRTAQKYLITNK